MIREHAEVSRDARAWRIATWVAMALFAVFRLPELTRYSLWYDELFSLTLAQQDWSELFRRAALDRTNPPLFYALLKLWIGIGGESVAWMRLLPCLAGTLVAVPLVALARRWLSDLPSALAAVAAGAASPLAVFLSNELRGYSLLLLLSAVSYLAYARLTDTESWDASLTHEGGAPSPVAQASAERRRRVAILAAVNVALVYTHYFGWLVVAVQLADAFFRHRRAFRWLIGAAFATGIAVIPWVATLLVGARNVATPLANVDWISVPAPLDIPRFYDALVARVLTLRTAWIGAVIVAAPLGALTFRRIRARRSGAAAWFAWYAVFPVAAAYVASTMMGRSVFVPRYLIIAAPAWWLLIGLAMTAADDARRSHVARAVGAAVFSAFTLAAGTTREVRGGEKIQWNAVVSAIAADAGTGGGRIYALEGFTALPAAYYAATLDTRLTVRPVRDLAAIVPPAWLLVRSGVDSGSALGAGLLPRGLALTPVYRASVPSHTVTAYRVTLP